MPTVYTNITKPSGTTYTPVNLGGKYMWDDPNIFWDDPNVFWDGLNVSQYTNVTKPSGTVYTNLAKPT